MIPLRDNIRTHRFPIVNYSLIGVSAVVFFLQLTGDETITEQYGMIPKRITRPGEPVEITRYEPVRTIAGPAYRKQTTEAVPPPFPAWLTLLTSIFLHGGWLHFLGNMWFLHIFGDNVEDRLGHFGYVTFYLGTGVAAGLAHLASDPSSTLPTIGASGAIAGVMGGYFLLFPRAQVLTLIPIFFFLHIVIVPASFFLGIWFLLQFLQGSASITSTQTGGVAWWAHIGGFAAGAAAVGLLRLGGYFRSQTVEILPTRSHRIHFRR